jgi:hypothetical protein
VSQDDQIKQSLAANVLRLGNEARDLAAVVERQERLILRLLEAGKGLADGFDAGCGHDEDLCDPCAARLAIWERAAKEAISRGKK